MMRLGPNSEPRRVQMEQVVRAVFHCVQGQVWTCVYLVTLPELVNMPSDFTRQEAGVNFRLVVESSKVL